MSFNFRMNSKTTTSFTNPLFGSQSNGSPNQYTSGSSTVQRVQLQDHRPPPGTPTDHAGKDSKTTDSSLQNQLALLTFELQNLHQTLLYFQINYNYRDGFKTPSIQSPLSTAPTMSNKQSETPSSSCSCTSKQQLQEEDAIDKLLDEAKQRGTINSINSTHGPSSSPPPCSSSTIQSEGVTYTLPTRLPTLYIPPLSHHQRNISSEGSSSTTTNNNSSSRRRRNLPPPPPALVPAKSWVPTR